MVLITFVRDVAQAGLFAKIIIDHHDLASVCDPRGRLTRKYGITGFEQVKGSACVIAPLSSLACFQFQISALSPALL